MRYFLLVVLSMACFAATLQAQTITTIAGNGNAAFAGDGGQATAASIYYPYDVASDAAGNVFIADYYNHAVRKITPAGVITTVAGIGGNGGYSGDGGPAVSATLYYPSGLAFDAAGNLYIGDAGNQVIRKVSTSGTITTFAGTGSGGYNGDEIDAKAATLYKPSGMLFDKTGSLIFSDILNHRIRKITPDGKIHTIAGNGIGGYSGDGGQAVAASINVPHTIYLDKDGNLYIPDYGNNRLRKVNTTGIITTIAGNGGGGFSGDGGPATSAQVNPVGIAMDASGNIYISDPFNNRIRKITNGVITTVAGNGTESFSGDGGNPLSAGIYNPWGIWFDKNGALLVCDRFNNRIRKIVLAIPTITSFTPTSAGKTVPVVITGTNFTGATAVSFGGVPALSFTVNSATQITARPNTGSTGDVSVTTPAGTATKSGFVYCLTPSVSIKANIASPICAGTEVTFTATAVNGGTSAIYQWTKNGVNVGSNSTEYKDNNLKTTDTIRCVLTSNASPCVTSANVTSNAIVFTVNPFVTPVVTITALGGVNVCKGVKMAFKATVTNGGSAPVYKWWLNDKQAGTNSAGYVDSLPVDGDSVSLTVTSNAACLTESTVKSNVLKLKIDSPEPVITIAANKDTAICAGTTVTFTATVKPSFLWKKNGVIVGDNSNVYVDSTLKANDNVQSFLVSTVNACNNNSSNILNSNVLKFKVSAPPATPSAISGPATIPVNYAGAYFSVTAVAGVTYAWTLPSGAVIDSGQGGNKIKVTWGSSGGTVSVIAINSCGASSAVTKSVAIGSTLSLNTGGPGTTPRPATLTSNIKLTPNPARTTATLTFKAIKQDTYTITIADAQYKVLAVKTGVSIKGTNMVKLNVAGYASGMYFVILTNKESGRQSKQLVIGE